MSRSQCKYVKKNGEECGRSCNTPGSCSVHINSGKGNIKCSVPDCTKMTLSKFGRCSSHMRYGISYAEYCAEYKKDPVQSPTHKPADSKQIIPPGSPILDMKMSSSYVIESLKSCIEYETNNDRDGLLNAMYKLYQRLFFEGSRMGSGVCSPS